MYSIAGVESTSLVGDVGPVEQPDQYVGMSANGTDLEGL